MKNGNVYVCACMCVCVCIYIWVCVCLFVHTHIHIYLATIVDDMYIYVYIYIIIIMPHHQHGYPWPSLATPPYRPLLRAGLQGYISYRNRAAVYRFELVGLPLLVHVKGSTGVHHSSLLLQQCPICLVRLIFIVFVMGCKWPYSCCFVGCCLQDLFNIARSILV